jgi:hypothetical protein
VQWGVRKYGLSERNIWKYLRLARKTEDALIRSHREPSKQTPSPYDFASAFLILSLHAGPKPATEMRELSKSLSIAPRTLERAAKELVKARRIGGTHGYWIWELKKPAFES